MYANDTNEHIRMPYSLRVSNTMSKQQLQEGRNWYVVHTYAGYENAVMRNLKQRIESLGMQDKIFNVIVPTEKKIKIKAGKRVEEEEKIYPGYILVDMIVTDDSWYVVRNTPRVTGFVGPNARPRSALEKRSRRAPFPHGRKRDDLQC